MKSSSPMLSTTAPASTQPNAMSPPLPENAAKSRISFPRAAGIIGWGMRLITESALSNQTSRLRDRRDGAGERRRSSAESPEVVVEATRQERTPACGVEANPEQEAPS